MRDRSQEESLDGRMQRYAAGRYGVVTRDELIDLGYTRSAISRRTKSGILIKMRPGIFRVQAVKESWMQALYAVCRWLEPAVVVSHRAAARFLNIGDIRADLLEVTVAGERHGARDVILHTSANMPARDRRVRQLIPVTDPTRTCIDCCSVLSESAAQHVIDDACHQRLTTTHRLMQRIEEMSAKGRNGLALARKLVDQRTHEGEKPESRLTRMLLRLIQRSYLPNPVSLFPITLPNGVNLHPDLAYPALMIAIEADGFEEHGKHQGWQADKHRDNPLQVLGWIVLRFTWEDVTQRPEYVIATIEDALRSRGVLI